MKFLSSEKILKTDAGTLSRAMRTLIKKEKSIIIITKSRKRWFGLNQKLVETIPVLAAVEKNIKSVAELKLRFNTLI